MTAKHFMFKLKTVQQILVPLTHSNAQSWTKFCGMRVRRKKIYFYKVRQRRSVKSIQALRDIPASSAGINTTDWLVRQCRNKLFSTNLYSINLSMTVHAQMHNVMLHAFFYLVFALLHKFGNGPNSLRPAPQASIITWLNL